MARLERPEEDTVGTAPSPAASGTTITMDTESLWKRNVYAERVPSDGSESEIIVFAADASGSTNIRRAQRGTTASGDWTAGDVVRVNPLYPRSVLARFINEVIDTALYPNVWYRSERTLTWAPLDRTYSLNADDFKVLQMYQYDTDGNEEYRPFPDQWWDEVESVAASIDATGKLLLLRRVWDPNETVYYTARTKPSSDAIASLPDRIANMVPWAVCAKVLGGTRVPAFRFDPNRQGIPESQESGPARDWQYFQRTFLLMRSEEQRRLQYEERGLHHRIFRPSQRRQWA